MQAVHASSASHAMRRQPRARCRARPGLRFRARPRSCSCSCSWPWSRSCPCSWRSPNRVTAAATRHAGVLRDAAGLSALARTLATAPRLGPGRPLDLAAVVALLAALTIVLSGAVDADDLASGGTAPATLLVLPGLVAFAVAAPLVVVLRAVHGSLSEAGVGGRTLTGVRPWAVALAGTRSGPSWVRSDRDGLLHGPRH